MHSFKEMVTIQYYIIIFLNSILQLHHLRLSLDSVEDLEKTEWRDFNQWIKIVYLIF